MISLQQYLLVSVVHGPHHQVGCVMAVAVCNVLKAPERESSKFMLLRSNMHAPNGGTFAPHSCIISDFEVQVTVGDQTPYAAKWLHGSG